MRIEIPVTRTVPAYQCDACESICETESDYKDPDNVCTWIKIFDQSYQIQRGDVDASWSHDSLYLRWQSQAVRYFCSWACVSSWAFLKSSENAPVVRWSSDRV